MQRFGGRAFWTFVDQAVSSLTSAILAILVGRSVSESAFGAFSIAILVFTFAVGLSRAAVTDPMMVRFSGREELERRDAVAKAVGAATLFGILLALPTAAVGAVAGRDSQLGPVLLSLAVALPGLLQQDAWRFTFFMVGRTRSVAFNDGVRALLMFAMIGWLDRESRVAAPAMILAWGLSAYAAAALGWLQAWTVPAVRGIGAWMVGHRDLSFRLGADFAINQGAYNGTNMAVGPVSSLASVGALNASRTLLGPLSLLFAGSTAMILPILSKRTHRSLVRLATVCGVGLAGMAAVWTVFLILMPEQWGLFLLKDNWAGAFATVPGIGLALVLAGAAVGPNLALKARSQGSRLLRITFVQAPLLVVLGLGGAYWFGAVGASWGFAAAQSVGLILTWITFLRVEREESGA